MQTVNPEPLDPGLLTLYHDPEYLGLLRESSKGEVRLEMLACVSALRTLPLSRDLEWSLRACGGTHHAAMET